MNHCVPEFETDEEYSIPTSSGLTRSRKSSMPEEEIMELLWQNGQVVVQSQNQRSLRKSQSGEVAIPAEQSAGKNFRSEDETATHLFMQEDEMASWLHYPLDDSPFDRDIYSDILYPPPSAPLAAQAPEIRLPEVRPPPQSAVALAPRPPVPPTKRLETQSSGERMFQNFMHFSKAKGRSDCGPSNQMKTTREPPVVVNKPSTGPESRISRMPDISGANFGSRTVSTIVAVGKSVAPRDLAACELTVTSSPGGSGASVSAASAEPSQKLPTAMEDRKRKVREADDSDCHSEGVEFESADAKKQIRGSTSTKRSRAAEVHNLSERRRRDRINEKMKALQELIPGCNKSDKASMLDEAIEHLKSLQLQVQMMSMGCSMVPVMFPGVQQYMPPMALGMGMGMGMSMGMGMGMDMGMTRPLVPFPMQNPANAANMPPRFPMPHFHIPPQDPSRMNQRDHHPMPNLADPYHHSAGLHHTRLPLPQNQATGQPNTSNNKDVGCNDNNQSG